LYEGLTKAGFDVVLLETRDVKAVLSAIAASTAAALRVIMAEGNSRA
jgi:hypothetical protein